MALKRQYSKEKNWHKEYSAIFYYLIYLIAIYIGVKNNKKFIILVCPHCGIPVISKCCNRGRLDVACTFGCRQGQKKSKANKRAKKYYRGKRGQLKKYYLNRARYDNTIPSSSSSSSSISSPISSPSPSLSLSLSLSPSPSPSPQSTSKRKPATNPWHLYIQFFLLAIFGEKISIQEIVEILKLERNSRSHGLDSS